MKEFTFRAKAPDKPQPRGTDHGSKPACLVRHEGAVLAKLVPRASGSSIRMLGFLTVAGVGLVLVSLLGLGQATGEEARPAFPDETDIPIVLQVVSCAPDLLHCRDINTQGMAFAKMSNCSDELAAVQARARKGAAPDTVIFARCRYSPAPARKAPALDAVLRDFPSTGTTEKTLAATTGHGGEVP